MTEASPRLLMQTILYMINKINVISKVVTLQITYDKQKMLIKDFTVEEHKMLTGSTAVISSIASPSHQYR